MFLKERNNERFYGGDYPSEDEITQERTAKKMKNSFEPELKLLHEKYPEQVSKAFGIWIDADNSKPIPYIEGK